MPLRMPQLNPNRGLPYMSASTYDGPMLKALAFLAVFAPSLALAQHLPDGSKPASRELASAPKSGLCWQVTSATAPACLSDASGPIYFPPGTVVRVYAVAAANPFFTQAAAGDLTVTANTLSITDASTACGIGGYCLRGWPESGVSARCRQRRLPGDAGLRQPVPWRCADRG
jgi:hypothetical protein